MRIDVDRGNRVSLASAVLPADVQIISAPLAVVSLRFKREDDSVIISRELHRNPKVVTFRHLPHAS
ncbi:hypothetical protein [Streptomyces sp. NPDC054794]